MGKLYEASEPGNIKTKGDWKLFVVRIEVRSKRGDSYPWFFPDSPPDG